MGSFASIEEFITQYINEITMQRVRFNFNLCIVYLGQLYSCHLIQGNHEKCNWTT